MLECLDDTALRQWCASGLAALRRHQREIDELNVYPVPDGDTGTNLVLTMASAQQAMDAGTGEALPLMARGALLGARGNSGVIVSQILRGLAEGLAGVPRVRGRALAEGLRVAAASAYRAVTAPVEGTVLTVASEAAHAAGRVGAASDELVAVVEAAARAAADALRRTPEQLPTLAAAGVVDAGGRGLVVLLDALVEVVTGVAPVPAPSWVRRPRPLTAARESGSARYAYEVRFLLESEADAVERMKGELAGLGDSLVVVGGDRVGGDRVGGDRVSGTGAGGDRVSGAGAGADWASGTGAGADVAGEETVGGTWHVHVHVNDVGAAIEAGVTAGRPHHISVTRFEDQIAGPPFGAGGGSGTGPRSIAAASPAEPSIDPERRGAVVVAAGEGLARLLAGEGVAVAVANPSTEELLAAVRATGAARVVVLPNDPDAQAVAAAAAREAIADGWRVSVVPTRSPVQALAALAVRDPGRPFEDDVIAMAEAAGACRYAEVCHAGREAITMAGPCRAGDVLALVEGEVHLVGTDLGQTCRELLDRMLGGGGELVTLLLGAQAPAGLGDQLRAHLAEAWPFMEVQVYEGGQPHYPLLVGVE